MKNIFKLLNSKNENLIILLKQQYSSVSSKSNIILSPAEANRILRKNESTIDLESKCPIKYYEVNYLGANNPAEDRQAQSKCLANDCYLFGVFDGHGGYKCSDTVSQRLFDYIALNLLTPKQLEEKIKWNAENKNYPLWFAYYSPYEDLRTMKMKEIHQNSLNHYAEELLTMNMLENNEPLNMEQILTNSFLKLDRDIIIEALPAPGHPIDTDMLDTAISGSCATVALLKGKDLYVGNCGDARAIIGQENEDGTYTPLPVSYEHNAENMNEIKRIFSEHPKNEHSSIIRDGRLLELLLPFRAFGDVRFKWSAKDLKEYVVPNYGHGTIPNNYFSPPYVTAKPEVVHRKLTYKDKFLVLATDGLWELLSPERVVQLVGNHMNGQQSFDPYQLPTDRSIKMKELYDDLTKRRTSLSNQPIDHNSSTHLIRYALGKDHVLLSNYLVADSPRQIRDDITITVVYFDTVSFLND
jgi:pyruvate dehydrogenase phosphatase